VSGTSPVFIKQLLPAVILTAAGALVLGHLSQPVSTPSASATGEAAINAEAVFTSTPRPVTEEAKPAVASRTVSKPKIIASTTPARQPEAPAMQQAAVGAPLSIAPSAEQMQTASVDANDTSIMGKVRSIGSSVQQLPQRTYSTVTGWFSPSAPSAPTPDGPPRPPADIPQKFKAEM
jgi:hypothetical protein